MFNIISGPVVQLVSTPPCHGGGRRFEPDQGRLSSFIGCSYYDNWGLSSAGRAPALQAGGHRFEPCRPQLFSKVFSLRCEELADVAQLAEQLICNQQVIGSSPIIGSVRKINMGGFPSGQREQTVNLLAMPSKVRILLRPLMTRGGAVWKLVGLITRRS